MIAGWEVGARVGPYRLEAEIGRGGMGVVYRASHAESGAIVVLKTLTVLDPDEVARLEREGLALGRLQHRNLVQVHSAGWHEGRPYLVLQFAAGGSLGDRFARGALPWAEAVDLIAPLANALAAAHELGITHRDLKPDNVLLDERGIPLLADFGLARVSDLSRMTETGTVLGTPLYMAPEQARGEDSGGQADVYSLAAVLFAAVAGRPPIQAQAGGVMAQLVALQETSPPRLGSLTSVPSWLDDLLRLALSRDPALRPSARGFEARLRAGEDSPASGKRPWIWAALLSALALGSTGVALAVGAFGPREAQASPVVSRGSPEVPVVDGRGKEREAYALHLGSIKLIHVLARRKDSIKSDLNRGSNPRLVKSFPEFDDSELGRLVQQSDPGDLVRGDYTRLIALELCLRGYLEWIDDGFVSTWDLNSNSQTLGRLARLGHNSSQWLLQVSQKRDEDSVHSYHEAHSYLSITTDFARPRHQIPRTLKQRSQRLDLQPRHIGEAWICVLRHDEIPLASGPGQSKSHGLARTALRERRPGAALLAYRLTWEAGSGDSESLAAELAGAAEWEWNRQLAAWGCPLTQGTPPPDRRRSLEDLRLEMDSTLASVEWAGGWYLRALTLVPEADPRAPFPAPDPQVAQDILILLDRSLRLDPGFSPALLLRAQALRWKGDPSGAIAALDTLSIRTPRWKITRWLLRSLLLLEECRDRRSGLSPEAELAYQEAQELFGREQPPPWVAAKLTPLYSELKR